MFVDSFQKKIWQDKYQYKGETFNEFCKRIASNIFSDDKNLCDKLYNYLYNGYIVFGGRINSNIGVEEQGLTLFNCFIESIGKNPDSLEGIMSMVSRYITTLKTEGGVGFCANFLRPANTLIRKIGVTTPGSIKFLELFDKASEIITAGSVDVDTAYQGEPFKKSIRKGATMVTMSISHPDIEEFIKVKSTPNRLTKMNMSVLISDAFMYAVENDLNWDLWFPDINHECYESEWFGDFEDWASKGYSTVIYKTVKAADLWDLLLSNTYSRNEPGILFVDNIRKADNLYYLDKCSITSTNPCGEIPGSTGMVEINDKLINMGDICCLGAINVVKFYDVKTKQFNIEEFLNVVELLTKALDNVIDISNYPLKEYKEAALLKRKIGVGIMGVGSLMMMMDMTYGSFECVKFIENMLDKFMNCLYKTSALIAKEKGPFVLYDAKLLEGGYVGNSGVLSKETIELIKKYGLRNSALAAIAPNGCLVGDTIVATNKGCFNLENNLFLPETTQNIKLSSDFGNSDFKAWFNMGFKNTIRIKTLHGYVLEGTPEHKVRVISSGNGYIWKALKDLKEKDIVVMKKSFIFDRKTQLSVDRAEFLGFYMAKGRWRVNEEGYGKKLCFQICNEEVDYITSLLYTCFNQYNISVIKKLKTDENIVMVEVSSVKLYDWFMKYCLIKSSDSNAFIPSLILEDSKEVIVSFIKGFFKGNGVFNKNKQNLKFVTVSEIMASQLHIMLLGLGIPSRFYTEKIEGRELAINGKEAKFNYNILKIELTTFNSIKLCKLMGVDYSVVDEKCLGKNFEPVVLSPEEINIFDKSNYMAPYIENDVVCVTDYVYKNIIEKNKFNWFVSNNLYIDVVNKITNSTAKNNVYDISIYNQSHTYVANGFVTHNTGSILAGNVSGGLEPVFAKEFVRWNRVEGQEKAFDYPDVHKNEWYETDYFKEESVAGDFMLLSTDGKYRVDKNNGLCKKHIIRDYGYAVALKNNLTHTKCATELNIKEHLNVLSVFSKYIDQSSSKTINLPNDISFDEFKKLYGKLHSFGIKGCTTYREGTMVGVLETIKNEKKKTVKEQQQAFLDVFRGHVNGVVADQVKLPIEYPARGYILHSDGKKWYVHVAFKDEAKTKPFAVFVNTNHKEDNISTFNALDKLADLSRSVGLNGDLLNEVQRKYAYQKNPVKICRMLGFLLRHNVDVFYIVQALDDVEEATIGTFVHRIKKFLAQFVHEINEPDICPECNNRSLVFREGCYLCTQCMYTRC